MPQPELDRQEGFAGGMIVPTGANDVWGAGNPAALNTYQLTQDARLRPDGSISIRQGSRVVLGGSLGGPIMGGFSWVKTGAARQDLVVANGHLWTLATSGTFWLATDRGALTGAATTTVPSFAAFRDGTGEVVYIALGTPGSGLKLYKWDGTTLSTGIGSVVDLSCIWVYNERLFGVTGNDQIVWWSGGSNGDLMGTTASDGGFATVRTYGARNIIAGCAVGATNIFLHQTAVSAFVGTSQDDVNIAAGAFGMHGQIGIVGKGYIAQPMDGLAYVLSARGTAVVTEVGVTLLDRPDVPDPFAQHNTTAGPPLTSFTGGFALFCPWMEEIVWAPGGMIVWSTRYQRWVGTRFYNLAGAINCGWLSQDSNGFDCVLYGCADGFIRETDTLGNLFVYKDDETIGFTGGNFLGSFVTLRRFFGPDRYVDKVFERLDLWGLPVGGNTAMVYNVRGQGDATFTGMAAAAYPPAPWANANDPVLYHCPIGLTRGFVEIQLPLIVSTTPFQWYSASLTGTVLARRGA